MALLKPSCRSVLVVCVVVLLLLLLLHCSDLQYELLLHCGIVPVVALLLHCPWSAVPLLVVLLLHCNCGESVLQEAAARALQLQSLVLLCRGTRRRLLLLLSLSLLSDPIDGVGSEIVAALGTAYM